MDAIVESLDGTNIVSDLSKDEVDCFAKAIHDGKMSDELLNKLVANDSELSSADKDGLDEAASSAASKCGFSYNT